MRIRYLKPYMMQAAGDTGDVDPGVAELLIGRGVARALVDESPRSPDRTDPSGQVDTASTRRGETTSHRTKTGRPRGRPRKDAAPPKATPAESALEAPPPAG